MRQQLMPRRVPALAALLSLPLAVAPSLAGVVQVQVKLPAEQRLDTANVRRVLVAGFRASDHLTLSLDKEVAKALKDLIRRKTGFELIDADPPPLPEQPIEEAMKNEAYWRRLGQRFNADLIIGGTVDYASRDESGFSEQDQVMTDTLQRNRHTVWVEREGFRLELGLYFFRGTSGKLVFEDHFTEEMVFRGKENDDLSVLLALFERLHESILGIVIARPKVETRYLFTE